MALVFNDTTNRNGLIQWCEDTCGLGPTGITSDTTLFQQFTRWMNQWNKVGFGYAILAFRGSDIDDPNYTTAPTGYFSAGTNRDYYFDPSYVMLRIKQVNISYDGKVFFPATPFDDNDKRDIAVNDVNVDKQFSQSQPYVDFMANGFKIYPAFTSNQVTTVNSLLPNGSGGNKAIYVEFFRAPKEFATSGTDSYTTGFDLPFQHLPAVGASYEYCKLYKPELSKQLALDLYGNNGNIKGLIKEMDDWYNSKQPSNLHASPLLENYK